MIFYSYAALKSYSLDHLLGINSLVVCDFALLKSKISILEKTSFTKDSQEK